MQENKNRIMAHLIAGYPDLETSYKIAEILIESGVSALEIQFPFSDPSADGPAIQKASAIALEKGFKVNQGFEFVKRIKTYKNIPVFIMTYGSIVYTGGVENFVRQAASSGAEGLIIPDLPFDYDEGLYQLCRSAEIECVPVLVPSMTKSRIEKVIELKTRCIYAALRSGTTGVKTEIDRQCKEFLSVIRSLCRSNVEIMAGFGLRTREQITALEGLADYYIVGSALVMIIDEIQKEDRADTAIGYYIKSLI